ncbi:MAG: hypothetical protein HKN08_09900, partial [Gammaproteobacteria bacterium]|nr:hypothetical protein [Gammaproteobacteria bacterium]
MTSENTEQTETDNQESSEQSPVDTNRPKLFIFINLALLIAVAAVATYNIKSIREIRNDNSVSQIIDGINRNVEQVSGDLGVINSQIQQYEAEILSLSAAVKQSNESLEILYSS